MDKTRYILSGVFFGVVAFFLLVVLLFETGIARSGALASATGAEYFVRMIMEISALVCIPLALRLFRFDVVRRSLYAGGNRALRTWGVPRILMLGLPMVASMVFYYLFEIDTYGYISLIFIISMVFVYPGKERCESEVKNTEES